MTTAVLLDHVAAYAAAVRTHLRDLSPEQVEDLTDGLEADLAEALEDSEGPVVTGEIPIGHAAGGAGFAVAPGGATMIDLTRRFGEPADYAAELRAAAGLEPGRPGAAVVRRLGSLGWRTVAARVPAIREEVSRAVATPAGRRVISWLATMRPLWWLVRGWVWFVVLYGLQGYVTHAFDRGLDTFVPRSTGTWALALGLLLVSIAVGRGLGRRHRWGRVLVVLASTAALLWLPGSVTDLRSEVDARLTYSPVTQYVNVPVTTPLKVEDGVYVDGMAVSNLFVYDADGNPLEGVQIFDDRGRPVRTTHDGGLGSWQLPGVTEPWSFAPSHDGDGRNRWNVYPLLGAPSSAWEDVDGVQELRRGEDLRVPPLPFAKAPAVVVGQVSAA